MEKMSSPKNTDKTTGYLDSFIDKAKKNDMSVSLFEYNSLQNKQ